jgi:S-(hydroxymethyl)glutathione dehydrogenase/alcohol dehydrogenase
MKAALLTELNKDLEVRDDVEVYGLGPKDVRVQVKSSGVCHSDVSVQNGTIPMALPVVLGHEGAGVVQEVGEAVTSVVPGDHVILTFVPACCVCTPCLRGQSYLCNASNEAAAATHFMVDGTPTVAMTGLGTFAEETIVGDSAVVKIGQDVPLDVAALVGCGVTTGVGASINAAGVTPGSSVVVFGCGGVGISAIQGARIAGASSILAVDTVESKLEQAKHFGATDVATPDGLADARQRITGGEGFDFALECIGSSKTIRATYDAIRRGGVAVVVGVGRIEDMVQFSAFELFYSSKTLRSSVYGDAQVRTFMPELLSLWKAGKLDLESMISRRIQLDEVNDAFRAMQAGEVIRTVIDF